MVYQIWLPTRCTFEVHKTETPDIYSIFQVLNSRFDHLKTVSVSSFFRIQRASIENGVGTLWTNQYSALILKLEHLTTTYVYVGSSTMFEFKSSSLIQALGTGVLADFPENALNYAICDDSILLFDEMVCISRDGIDSSHVQSYLDGQYSPTVQYRTWRAGIFVPGYSPSSVTAICVIKNYLENVFSGEQEPTV